MTLATQTSTTRTVTTTTDVTTMSSRPTYGSKSASTSLSLRSTPGSGCFFYKKKLDLSTKMEERIDLGVVRIL